MSLIFLLKSQKRLMGGMLMSKGNSGLFKGTNKSIRYPGNDNSKSPGKGFEWRGKSSPSEGKGNWYNPKTGERWNSDLNHGDPIGPHWDYTDSSGNKYRVFPDGRVERK